MTDTHDEYSPEAIHFWVHHWQMLTSACEGGTGASGLGSGRGGRMSLVCLKADLERAADTLPPYWQSTAYIFHRQRRTPILTERRRVDYVPVEERQYESPIPSDALEQACYRMALALGWRSEQENVA